MSSTDKQGSSLGSFPTSPPLYPHFNRPSGFSPCVKSCLVGGSDKYSAGSLLFAFCEAPEPVLEFGPERGSAKGTMADLGPLIRHLVSTNYLWVAELHFCLLCPPCTALDHASSLSRKLAYVPGPTLGFKKLLASSGSHCTK